MTDVLKLLDFIRDKIGPQSIVFLVMSFVTVLFAKQLDGGDVSSYRTALQLVGGILFAIGLLAGLLNVFVAFFRHRPARGLLDGLVAAALASVVGGGLGYAYHSGEAYTDPAYLRLGLCALFAIPAGGVLGLCFDLFQSDRVIPWRAYLAALVGSFLFLVAITTVGIAYFIPTVTGAGIIASDLLLLFEWFLVFSVVGAAIQFSWDFARVIRGAFWVAAGIIPARLILHSLPAAPGPAVLDPRFVGDPRFPKYVLCKDLSCFEFVVEPGSYTMFGVMLATMMIWVVAIYGMTIRLSPVLPRFPGRSPLPIETPPTSPAISGARATAGEASVNDRDRTP